jgi:hypothetical protein
VLLTTFTACAPRHPTCQGDPHCRAGERCLQGRCERHTATRPIQISAAGQAAALQRACDSGNPDSCYLLARQHRAGRGVNRDAERADALLHQACNGDHAGACAALKRPVPYTATFKGAVPGLRIPGYTTIYIGPVAGAQGQALRAALKQALQESCRCFVVIANDIELLNQGELAVVGRVLQVEQVPRDQGATPPASAPSSAPALAGPPARCARVSLSAKLWLFDGAAPDRTRELLLHGRAVAEERCARALRAATASLASELTARLDRSHTYRVTLFRAAGHPALQAGNDLALAAKWEAALEQYGQAVTDSGELLDGKEPRAHAHYARSLALSELGRYTKALAALKQAQLLRPDPRYLRPLQRLQLSTLPAFAQGPPAQPRRTKATKKSGKQRKVIQGLRRTVIYR